MLCRFTFSPEWDGLICNAVCRGSGEERVVLNVGAEEFDVPWECLTLAGSKLEIGVEGRNGDGTVVFPTKFAYVGRVETGVNDEGEEGAPPTPSQMEQLQAQIAGKVSKDYVDSIADQKADKTALKTLSEVVASIDNDIDNISDALIAEARTRAEADESLDKRVKELEEHGGGGGGAVSSVNGKTGAVVLNASDVGALPDDTPIPTVPTDEIEANTAARHTHGNKSVIDGITAERVENWDKALTSGVSDVTIDGNSVVNDGVADIPVAATGRLGVIQVVSISGLKVGPTGILTLDFPTIEHVSDRKYGLNQPKPVTLGRLDYAVCASLTDGKSASLWTEDKQQAARALLGISIWDGSVSE